MGAVEDATYADSRCAGVAYATVGVAVGAGAGVTLGEQFNHLRDIIAEPAAGQHDGDGVEKTLLGRLDHRC